MFKANYVIKLAYITFVLLLGTYAFPSMGTEDIEDEQEVCGKACHVMKPYEEAAKNDQTLLAFTHIMDWEATCSDCHERSEEDIAYEKEVYESGDYDEPLYRREYENDFCFACHATYKEEGGLIERTAHLEEEWEKNPHDSHLGEDVECNQCHRVHQPSKFVCGECHKANWNERLSPGWYVPNGETEE